MSEDKNIKIARLIGLEKKAREARDKDELNFLVVNETREIINYTNSFLLLKSPTDKYHVNAISDLATVDRTAPLVTFVVDFMNDKSLKDLKEIELIDLEKFTKAMKRKKPNNIPQYLLCVPIFSPQKGLQGYLILSRNDPFKENESELLRHLSRTYGHAYNTFLSKLRCFDTTNITEEDKIRVNLYKSESKRTKLKQQLKSVSDWIKTLNLTIVIENIKNENTPRAVQLLNKTNQMNLSTRRLSEQEFDNWVQIHSNNLWTIRAADKFGDYGIIGILSISIKDSVATLVDFILSCRVVGRYIEETMIEFLKEFCKENKVDKINGKYIKTKKNSLCYHFFNKLKLVDNKQDFFEFSSNQKKLNLLNITVKKPTHKEKIDASKNFMAK